MKKKLLLIPFIVLSIFFISITNIKSEGVGVTSNNNNTDVSGGGGSGSDNTITNGITGGEMQGMKVAIYRANGTIVGEPKYVILRDGQYSTNNFCTCGNNYNFATTTLKPSACTCTKNNNIKYEKIDGISGSSTSTMYWGLYFSKPSMLTALLETGETGEKYENLFNLLHSMNYENGDSSYKYQQGDYLIIEPLITVSCQTWAGAGNSQYVTGTINSLILNNFSFYNGTQCGTYKTDPIYKKIYHPAENCNQECVVYGRYASCHSVCDKEAWTETTDIIIGYNKTTNAYDMFKWYYSAVAQSFKVKPNIDPNKNACAIPNPKNSGTDYAHEITFINTNDYAGCGYNRFDLSQVITEPPVSACTVVTKDNQKTYYGPNKEKLTGEAQYKEKCGCREVVENGTTVYYNSNVVRTSKQEYEKSCKSCAQRVTNNPLERIGLYNEYKEASSNADYRNLLDFSKTGASACTAGEKYKINTSCLTANSTDTFTATNLSKYTYTTDVNGKVAYCNSEFKLTSNVGTYFPTVKAGMAYLGGHGVQSTLATGTLTLKCYLYNNNITQGDINSDPFSSVSYNNFVSNVSLSGQNLDATVTAGNTSKNKQSNYVEYTKEFTAYYLLPKVYIDKITGMLVGGPNNNTTENYGLYSKFSDNGTVSVPFSITFGSNMKNVTVTTGNNCSYTAKAEIVVGDLNLKFRTIDTSNPFTGEDGKGRKVGANWCYDNNNGTWDCSSNNPLVQSVIKNTPNSYNRNGVTPKYKFVLSPLTINAIREYNNTVPIDEYRTRCTGSVCTNTFFESISNSIIIGRDLLIK